MTARTPQSAQIRSVALASARGRLEFRRDAAAQTQRSEESRAIEAIRDGLEGAGVVVTAETSSSFKARTFAEAESTVRGYDVGIPAPEIATQSIADFFNGHGFRITNGRDRFVGLDVSDGRLVLEVQTGRDEPVEVAFALSDAQGATAAFVTAVAEQGFVDVGRTETVSRTSTAEPAEITPVTAPAEEATYEPRPRAWRIPGPDRLSPMITTEPLEA